MSGDRRPGPPAGADDLGAMTGATGSLTPDEPDTEFVPAETREISDPATARDLTDPAYRMEEGPPGASRDAPATRSPAGGRPRLGGDELHAPEEEHF